MSAPAPAPPPESPWGMRIAGAILGLAALFIAGIFFGFIAVFLREARTYLWPQAPAQLVSCAIFERTKADPPGRFILRVKYHFDWQGQRLTSEEYTTEPKLAWHHLELRRIQDRVESAPQLRCFVDPSATPPRAILARPVYEPSFGNTAGFLFVCAIGAILGSAVWKKWRGPRAVPAAKARPALSDRAATGIGSAIVLVLGLWWGGYAFYVTEIEAHLTARRAQTWIEMPCEILWSILSTASDRTTTFMPDIFFRYTFEGKSYEASGVKPGDMPSLSKSTQEETVARFPRGTRATCWVNPQTPYQALLLREPLIPAIDRVWYACLLAAAPLAVFGIPWLRRQRERARKAD